MEKLAILGGQPVVTINKEFRWPAISEDVVQAVAEMVRKGELSDTEYGEATRALEEAWARFLGVEFALSRVDGTAALHSACFAAGAGPGDEVIVQSYTWVASVGCIMAAGAVPVFADIDPRTYTLDPADVERRITPRTRAILPVHLWGHPTEMDAIMDIARRHGLKVIEDASHAHGGAYKGRKVGTIGDIGCFSMQASKSLPAGEGGMMVTNDRRLFERALLLAQSPGRLKLHIQLEEHRPFIDTGFGGFKYRINVLNAVIARMLLPKLEERNAIRQRNMDRLSAGLAGVTGIGPAYTAPHVTRGGFYGFPILYKPEELDGLPMETFLRAVNAEGVPLKRDRYPMLHLCAMYRRQNPLGAGWPWSFSDATRAVTYQPGDLPVTESVYPRLLHIESWDKAEPSEDLFEQYAQGIRKVVDNARALRAAGVIPAGA